jgi:hypothetical protein
MHSATPASQHKLVSLETASSLQSAVAALLLSPYLWLNTRQSGNDKVATGCQLGLKPRPPTMAHRSGCSPLQISCLCFYLMDTHVCTQACAAQPTHATGALDPETPETPETPSLPRSANCAAQTLCTLSLSTPTQCHIYEFAPAAIYCILITAATTMDSSGSVPTHALDDLHMCSAAGNGTC